MDDVRKMLINESFTLRGVILYATVTIERKIDDFLSDYFCSAKATGNELKEMLWKTERINLGSKKDILFMLLNRHYKPFLKKYPKFITMLEDFIPHRNILAHLELDMSDISKEAGGLIFMKYKEGKLVKKKYSAETVIKLKNDISELAKILDDLILTNNAPSD